MAGICLVGLLSFKGWKSSTKQVESHDHATHDHSADEETAHSEESSLSPEELDLEVELALENIAKYREEGNVGLMMAEGIQKLLAVVRQDPDNVKANYHLGLFSIESGQLEKAEKRFEKLVLLQPENQEYQKLLSDIRSQLGK